MSAVGHQGPWPIPLGQTADPQEVTDPIPTEDTAWVRLGVLVPEDWQVASVSYQVEGRNKVALSPALPDELAQYDILQPAPPGYTWQAFGPVEEAVWEGAAISFSARITAGERTGVYRVGYLTWQGPWAAAVESEGQGVRPAASTTVDPAPSYIETEITVGDVGPAPHVTAFAPPDGAADVPVDTSIRVTFDRDMDLQSLREGGLRLYQGPVWFVDDRPGWETHPDWIPIGFLLNGSPIPFPSWSSTTQTPAPR